MNKLIKFECIILMIGSILSGITAQDNINCHRMDFNKVESILEFEQCSSDNPQFIIKSYSDAPLTSYGDGYENYLTNIEPEWSCFSTIGTFNLDENSELYTAIYLQSVIAGDESIVELQIFDGQSAFPVIHAIASNLFKWSEYTYSPQRSIENAKIEIRAFVSDAAHLGIQYLHIANSKLEEPECDINGETTDTTTEETTTDTTTEETTTDTTTEETTTDTTTEETTTDTTTEETTTDTTTEEITTDTTTEGTTTDTTSESSTDSTTTSPTTQSSTSSTTVPIPSGSNDNRVWIITSFVFFLTTIIAAAGSVYLIYLYKTALAVKTISLSSPIITSTVTTIPRLMVGINNRGDQVIVGMENFKQNQVVKS